MGLGEDLYQTKRPKVSFNSEMGVYEKINLINENYTYSFRIDEKWDS